MELFGPLIEKVKQYVDLQVRLVKLNLIGHVSKMMGHFVFSIMVLFVGFCIVLFLGFGLIEIFVAMGLPHVASLFIVIGIYIILLWIILAMRKKITKFFADGVVSAMTEDKENTD